MKTNYVLVLMSTFLYNSCATTKSGSSVSCSKQYSYKTNTVNIKGISAKLQKAGVQYADIGIAEITLDPKAVAVSEKMMQLDLFQYKLCEQIQSLPANDSSTKALQLKYSNALIEMMTTALEQDSTLKKSK